jgi:hypothetical protein
MENTVITKGKIATTSAAKPVLTILTSVKAIIAETDRVGTSLKVTQQDVHVLACSVLAHTAKHGNINILTQFLDKMPEMIRMNGLKTWFETFGQLTWDADAIPALSAKDGAESAKAKKGMWRIDRSKKPRLGDAMAKPFWSFKATEGKAYTPLTMDTYLDDQIKRLERDIKMAPCPIGVSDTRAAVLAGFIALKSGKALIQ